MLTYSNTTETSDMNDKRLSLIKTAIASTLNTMKRTKGTDIEITVHRALIQMRSALRRELTGEDSTLEMISASAYLESASYALGFVPVTAR
jgi:hypothetical protein